MAASAVGPEQSYLPLEISLFRVGESTQVVLSHSNPADQARVAPQRGLAPILPSEFLPLQVDAEAYGTLLSKQLFADPAIKTRFLQVETVAQATGLMLRLSLAIDPSAQDLQALRWETLRHPDSGAPLCTSERVLFSRFMVSRDWRPIRLRARSAAHFLQTESGSSPHLWTARRESGRRRGAPR